jgi:hypothetical protein
MHQNVMVIELSQCKQHANLIARHCLACFLQAIAKRVKAGIAVLLMGKGD